MRGKRIAAVLAVCGALAAPLAAPATAAAKNKVSTKDACSAGALAAGWSGPEGALVGCAAGGLTDKLDDLFCCASASVTPRSSSSRRPSQRTAKGS